MARWGSDRADWQSLSAYATGEEVRVGTARGVGASPVQSRYAETFWTATIGPTGLLLARLLVDMVSVSERDDNGAVNLPRAEIALRLGLGWRSTAKNSPLNRSFNRLRDLKWAHEAEDGLFVVHRFVAMAPDRALPEHMRPLNHAAYQAVVDQRL